VAFVAIQAAVSVAAGATWWISDPVYADKEQRLRLLGEVAPPHAPRVILLGTSRTGYGFAAGRAQQAAEQTGLPAVVFNFGLPGSGPVTHQLYLMRLLAAGWRPDLLLIEVLPAMLAQKPGGPVEGRTITGDRLSLSEIETATGYDVPGERLLSEWRQATVSPISAHRFKLLGRLLPDAAPLNLRHDWGRTRDPNGWNRSSADGSEVTEEERARGIARTVGEYREVMKCDLPAGSAAGALRDTLTLCRAEGIRIGLVLLPEATAFRRLYPPGAETRIAEFLAELTTEFGCPLTDARGWVLDDSFLDGHHLHRAGARAFTDRLTAEVILPFLRAQPTGRKTP
jgi:hypothetical protein